MAFTTVDMTTMFKFDPANAMKANEHLGKLAGIITEGRNGGDTHLGKGGIEIIIRRYGDED